VADQRRPCFGKDFGILNRDLVIEMIQIRTGEAFALKTQLEAFSANFSLTKESEYLNATSIDRRVTAGPQANISLTLPMLLTGFRRFFPASLDNIREDQLNAWVEKVHGQACRSYRGTVGKFHPWRMKTQPAGLADERQMLENPMQH